MITLGERIKQAREAKNLSQEDLAEYLSITRQSISKWENNLSVPQGVNREMLAQVLELDLGVIGTRDDANDSDKKVTDENMCHKIKTWGGWVTAAVLLLILIGVGAYWHITSSSETQANGDNISAQESGQVPTIKNIRFYDKDAKLVEAEALWYNAAAIESILVQWEGGYVDHIKMFYTPSGTETLDQTELLLTWPVLDGDTVTLMDSDALKEISMGDIYFQLDFMGTVVTSELYNVLYDESIVDSE